MNENSERNRHIARSIQSFMNNFDAKPHHQWGEFEDNAVALILAGLVGHADGVVWITKEGERARPAAVAAALLGAVAAAAVAAPTALRPRASRKAVSSQETAR
jgi:hypothetical protein